MVASAHATTTTVVNDPDSELTKVLVHEYTGMTSASDHAIPSRSRQSTSPNAEPNVSFPRIIATRALSIEVTALW